MLTSQLAEFDKPKSGRRVLIVDDERLLRWAVVETLTAHGYDVSEAGDAKTALQAFGASRTCTDLVLLDLVLPDACDLRLLHLIRAVAPAVPVILMTAFSTPEIAEQARAVGAGVFPKPFDMDALTALVDQTVARRPQ
jgi:DNA-binding NtrC family response regulator